MSRAPVFVLDPNNPEVVASIDVSSILRKQVLTTNSSRCDACNKIMEESEMSIRGYASGNELGLCRRCASFVNTEEAISFAERLGAKVHAKPIRVAPKSPSNHGLSGSEEVYDG